MKNRERDATHTMWSTEHRTTLAHYFIYGGQKRKGILVTLSVLLYGFSTCTL